MNKIVLYHLFPDLLNLYGDYGNISCLKFHLKSLGLDVSYKKIFSIDEFDKNECSFLLIGGGSDREQEIATNRLLKIKPILSELIENNLPVLAICGGFQFLGTTYECLDKTILNGLGILDLYTKASNHRMVGNIHIKSKFGDIVGFENHSGETFHSSETLGVVEFGYGNTYKSQNEGIVYKNVIGSYIHGPILPKNSCLILHYIKIICEYTQNTFNPEILDFEFEDFAQLEVIKKIRSDK